jgi:hypothetical protein
MNDLIHDAALGDPGEANEPPLHPSISAVSGIIPQHYPGAYPAFSCCGGKIGLVPQSDVTVVPTPDGRSFEVEEPNDVARFAPLIAALRSAGLNTVTTADIWNTGGNVMCLGLKLHPHPSGFEPYAMFSDDADLLGAGIYFADEASISVVPDWNEEYGEQATWRTPGLAWRTAEWFVSLLEAINEWIQFVPITKSPGAFYGPTYEPGAIHALPDLPHTLVEAVNFDLTPLPPVDDRNPVESGPDTTRILVGGPGYYSSSPVGLVSREPTDATLHVRNERWGVWTIAYLDLTFDPFVRSGIKPPHVECGVELTLSEAAALAAALDLIVDKAIVDGYTADTSPVDEDAAVLAKREQYKRAASNVMAFGSEEDLTGQEGPDRGIDG